MQFTPQELGSPAPTPPAATVLPPGGGQLPAPSFLNFASLIQTAAKTFRHTFDEALRDSPADARAMRRDPVLFDALRARQIPTAQLSFHLEPDDPTDPRQLDAVKVLTAVIKKTPRWQQFRMHLLEAVWYGKYAVQLAFAWDFGGDNPFTGGRRLVVRDFAPVHGDKLRFRWDGSLGVLVHGNYPGPTESTDYGLAHFFDPAARQQIVVHKFEPEDADFWEPEFAGRLHGVGLRDRCYWFWRLKSEVFALLLTYLERFANGLTLYYYDASNPQAKAEMQAAVQAQNGNYALLVPRWGNGRDQNAVERIEVGTATPSLLQSLVTEYFDDVLRRLILGQTMTYTAEAGGVGGDVAGLRGDTLARVVKYDAIALDDSLTSEFVAVLARHNCPGVPPPRYVSEIDRPNANETIGHAAQLQEMGVATDGDELREIAGLSPPQDDGLAVSKVGALQPSAVDTPAGVPVAGPSGPDPNAAPQPQPAAYPPQAAPPTMAPAAGAYQMARKRRPLNDHDALVAAVRAAPHDSLPKGVYADYLEEGHGYHADADTLRLLREHDGPVQFHVAEPDADGNRRVRARPAPPAYRHVHLPHAAEVYDRTGPTGDFAEVTHGEVQDHGGNVLFAGTADECVADRRSWRIPTRLVPTVWWPVSGEVAGADHDWSPVDA